MSKTRGALPYEDALVRAAARLWWKHRLTWREIGRILRRDYSGLRKAVARMERDHE